MPVRNLLYVTRGVICKRADKKEGLVRVVTTEGAVNDGAGGSLLHIPAPVSPGIEWITLRADSFHRSGVRNGFAVAEIRLLDRAGRKIEVISAVTSSASGGNNPRFVHDGAADSYWTPDGSLLTDEGQEITLHFKRAEVAKVEFRQPWDAECMADCHRKDLDQKKIRRNVNKVTALLSNHRYKELAFKDESAAVSASLE